MKIRKVERKKIFYKEGQVMLDDNMTVFHFKEYFRWVANDYFIEIVDLYDNLIKIPRRNIKYIFFHANNQLNKGGRDLG